VEKHLVPDIQTELGRVQLNTHSDSCDALRLRSGSHVLKGRNEGYANKEQLNGTISLARENTIRSIFSLIVKSPFKPRFTSARLILIVFNKIAMRSDSCTRGHGCY